jgi:peptidoglycan hydrolase-like protein with peptidoglycan-binding domain
MASRTIGSLPLSALALLIFVAPASAQFEGSHTAAHARGAPAQAGRPTAPPFASARGRRGLRGRRRLENGLFLYPDLFPDYYEPVETEEPPVEQQVVVQQPAREARAPAQPIEPLVLEERDGQWVRVPTGNQVPVNAEEKPASPSQKTNAERSTPSEEAAPPVAQLPAAVLVFRDGHREEVRNYMIQGSTLYTSADYWATGSWNKKIPISELDIPASLKANAERGAKFSLPRGPNQVVIRF